MTSKKQIENAIMELLGERGPGKTICPSDVARRLEPEDWRPLMPKVREAADGLRERKLVQVTQKGKAIASAQEAKGPIRIRAV